MIRLAIAILSFLPWWAYALIALGLGNLALDQHASYQSRVRAAERAILAGPPPARTTTAMDTRLRSDPFQEMQVTGNIRADLGLGQIEGAVPKSYIVLDAPERTGPVVAVMFVGTAKQAGLPDLVAASNDVGRVTASGFRRTLDWSTVSGQLRLQGVRREVVLMEAIVGDRAAALRGKAQADLPFIYVIGGLAALSGFVAYLRYSKWRGRRAAKRPRAAPTQVPQPAAAATPPGPASSPPRPAAVPQASPWATGTRTTSTTFADPPEDPESPLPEFESVFPGGGSGFRFKSADEIIRQSFGTVSTLDRAKGAKPDG
ncbi:hypothetical protein [Pseudooctadecabacter sp.]|uniref:hypothetical protein n=1 Tax=Pseudooctadecabacter sp. TaxID=1966338 RepID=UPI0035C80BEC